MPAPTALLVERMRRRGFVPLSEAAARASCSRSTILNYVRNKKVMHERCGYFYFVLESSFLGCFPYARTLEAVEKEEAAS